MADLRLSTCIRAYQPAIESSPPLRPLLAPKVLSVVLGRLGVQHFYTLVQQPSDETCIYYDFLPANPKSPLLMMATVLSGQKVKGVARVKKLQMPPRKKCWKVGKTKAGKGLESAKDFNTQWDCRLSLFHNCVHYSNDLVQYLTGEENVLSRLDIVEAYTSSDEEWDMFEASAVRNED